MVVDGSKNASDIVSQEFQMKDASPPVVKSLQVTPLHGGTRAEFTLQPVNQETITIIYVRKQQQLIQQRLTSLLTQQEKAKQKLVNLA